MKNVRKLLVLLLALTVCFCLALPAAATAETELEQQPVEDIIENDNAGDSTQEDSVVDPAAVPAPALEVTYVAQVGETKYETLAAAMEAAQEGDTVTLLENVTLRENLGINKNIKVVGTNKVALADGIKLSISAGTYDADITTYCAKGYNADKNEDGTYTVRPKVALPEVIVTDITDDVIDPELTFALNFAIKDLDKLTNEYLNKLMADYGSYYTDYVLTFKNMTSESVSFYTGEYIDEEETQKSDGFLAGQYDAWSKNWVCVPFNKPVTVEKNGSICIMETAADIMGQSGLRFTLQEVAEIVQNFDCGISFTPEFLASNPDIEVILELKVFTEDAEGNKIEDISVATNKFHVHDMKEVPAKEAGCTIPGNIAHLACQYPGCGKLFSAEDSNVELSADDVEIPAAHKTEMVKAKDATCTEDGNKEYWYCSVCKQNFVNKAGDALAEDVIIPAAHKLTFKAEVPAGAKDGTKAHYVCDVCEELFWDEKGEEPVADESELVIAAAKSIAFGKAEYQIYQYFGFYADVLSTPEDANVGTLTVTSSAPSIVAAEVEDGFVFVQAGDKTGEATLTVTTEYGLTASCKVIVNPIPAIKEGSTTLKMAVDDSAIYAFTPAADGKYSLYFTKEVADLDSYTIITKSSADRNDWDELSGDAISAADKFGVTYTMEAGMLYYIVFENFADKAIDETVYLTMDSHTCKLTKVPAKEATYTKDGNIEYYACAACDKKFYDAEGKKPVTGSVILPQLIEVVGEKAEVSTGAVDKAIEEAATSGDKKDVVLDLTHEEVVGEVAKPVTKTEIPVAAIEKVAEADASLTLTKEDATVTINTKALSAVTEAVAKVVKEEPGTKVENVKVALVVEEVKTEDLTTKQQEAVKVIAEEKKVAKVISAELLVQTAAGEKKIGTEADGGFGGGTVTVKIPFTPETGFQGSDYKVIYVADDGKVDEIDTEYKDGCLVVELEHFSDYVIVNKATNAGGNGGTGEAQPTEPTEPTKPATKPGKPAPNTGDNANIFGLFAMLMISGLLATALLVFKKKARA